MASGIATYVASMLNIIGVRIVDMSITAEVIGAKEI